MRNWVTGLAVSALVVALAGCDQYDGPPGTIHFVGRVIEPAPPNATPAQLAAVADRNRLVEDKPVQFRVTGSGTCGRLRVRFGDGSSAILWNANLDWDGQPGTGTLVSHTYQSGPGHWRGPKTITAEPVSNCLGGYDTVENVVPATMNWAFLQPGPVCGAIGAVRAGTVIDATTLNNPENKIRFSAFETHGIAGSVRPAPGAPFTFPFPGLRQYSLVLRVGSQVGQGGTGVPFTVAQDGQLELCMNDDVPVDNTGGWGIALTVDERGAP